VILPEIRSCSEVFGRMVDGPLAETKIAGVIIDNNNAFKIIMY
jgi:hypothetical protein